LAAAAMVVRLIYHNNLWERPGGQSAREQACCAALPLSELCFGVACRYALLFVVIVLAAISGRTRRGPSAIPPVS
jgi:hypothetical protein